MLTPADIHNKEFRRGFRGYSEEEVDDFLDEIVADYESMTRRLDKLESELGLARVKGEQYLGMEKQLQETLAVAQKTAEEVVKTAHLRADEKIREAELECDKKRRQTEAECDKMRRAAEADIRRWNEEADSRVKAQQALYNEGVQRRRQFIVKMKSLLRSELEILDGEPDEAPYEIADPPKAAVPAKAPAPAVTPHVPLDAPPASVETPPAPAVESKVPTGLGPAPEPAPAPITASKAEHREIPISEQDTATNFTGIKHRVEALLRMDERSLGTRRVRKDETRGDAADAKEQ